MKKTLQTALYPVKLNCYDGQPSLKSEQWIWIIAASVLHTIITQVICSDFLELMKKGLKLLKRSTKTNSTEKKFDYYQGFSPSSPLLWPGATKQCVCDEHEGASTISSSSIKQGPPCHWHGTSKPVAVTLHHYHHTSFARTPGSGWHIKKQGNSKEWNIISLIEWVS